MRTTALPGWLARRRLQRCARPRGLCGSGSPGRWSGRSTIPPAMGRDWARLCRPCRGRPNIRRHKSRLWRRSSDRRRNRCRRRSRLLRQVFEVSGDGREIGVGHLRARQHDLLRHDSRGGGSGIVAHLQTGRDIGDAPLTEPSLAVIGDVGRKPSLQRIALKCMRLIVAAEPRLWRMAGAAMLQTLDEVGAAIPFRGFRQFGFTIGIAADGRKGYEPIQAGLCGRAHAEIGSASAPGNRRRRPSPSAPRI
jgi:hypothetical protein